MIKLSKINKTFFKGKSNEVRAIVNTSLDLPEKGLVAICGPSGSGKTTLLNVLGGLEYIDSGEILYNDVRISKNNFAKLDQIRSQRIGYIFQHYYLFPQFTVYENIELVLHMIGLYDRAEIERRITYVLNTVGLLSYRHRKASALSGGQQQRVGIARAIAKNPEIIIADEPTGNLDSKNTIEIMNIIKKLSETKLIVLVTHEHNLAHFYSDQIIEIKDGNIISNRPNTPQASLDLRHPNTIYLKDLQAQSLANRPLDLQWYSDSASSEQTIDQVKIKLITLNDTLYIQVQHEEKLKVHYIDEQSNIEIYDEHFKGMDIEDVVHSKFDFTELGSTKASFSESKGSAIHAKDALVKAFRKLRSYSKLQKMMLISFVFSAMLIALAFSLFGRQFHITPDQFQIAERAYLSTDAPLSTLADLHDSIKFINPITEQQEFQLQFQTFYQLNTSLSLTAHPSDISLLKEQDINIGNYPKSNNEIVLDQQIIQLLLDEPQYKQAGIEHAEDFIGTQVSSLFLQIEHPLTIVGITDKATPTLWMHDEYIYMIAIQLILSTDEQTMANLTELSTIASLPERYEAMKDDRLLWVYSDNVKQTEHLLLEQQYTAVQIFNETKKQYASDLKKGYMTILSFAGGLIIISLLQLYFIIRSGLINQIYDIGVYRALGASRWDIYKMFIFEIALITTVTSLIGYLIMTIFIKELQRILPESLNIFHFPTTYIISGILLIYIINIGSGLFPVYRLTQKSPSQILKHHDA